MKKTNLILKFFLIMPFLIFIISCEKRDFKPVADVVLKTISDTMATTATVTGEIIDLGTGITDYGHCWSLAENPSIANSKTSLGSAAKIGTYTSELQNLEPGKTYHVKAYAKNGSNIFYSTNNLSFTTPGNPIYISSTIENATPTILEMTYNMKLMNILPDTSAFGVKVNNLARTVISVAISGTNVQVTLASPIVYGDVVTVAYTKPAINPIQTSSGGQAASINAQTVTNKVNVVIPTYVSSVIEKATPTLLTVTYNLPLANVVPATSAFTIIVNSVATTVTSVTISGTNVQLTLASAVVFGVDVTVAYTKPANNPLQTPSGDQATNLNNEAVNNYVTTIIDNDNNIYNIVIIGKQVWMAENLKTTKFNDNSAITNITDNAAWNGDTILMIPAYCWYNNDAFTYKASYGALYNWYVVDSAANNSKNVCPIGWHVPSYADWEMLANELGGWTMAGDKLKEFGTTHWTPPNSGATNETGFTALPGGFHRDLDFYNIGSFGYWWSSEVDSPQMWSMSYNSSNFTPLTDRRTDGCSVRCLWDK